MSVTIGSARSSYGNTTRGDQHSGLEVSKQSYYVHSKGWRVFRAIDSVKQQKLALAMAHACDNNPYIGYSQQDRLSLKKALEAMNPVTYDPATVKTPVNCDCSSLVRVCCFYAGIQPDNFVTANEPSKLMATGEFVELTDSKYTGSSNYLRAGDILVTRVSGHTVIVLNDGPKAKSDVNAPTTIYKLGDRTLSNGCEGSDVKELQTLLIAIGYDCGKWGADGDFGDATEIAVTNFQMDHSLKADGIANAAFIENLYSASGTEDTTSGKYVHIVGGNCYIRTEPNTSATKRGTAKCGETYAYAGETSDAGWHCVRLNDGTTAWVSGKYSRLEG